MTSDWPAVVVASEASVASVTSVPLGIRGSVIFSVGSRETDPAETGESIGFAVVVVSVAIVCVDKMLFASKRDKLRWN